MPPLSALSDAAIAVYKAFDQMHVEFGIFGGYAVAALGGPRESKDLDCIVNCNKDWLVDQLSRIEGFRPVGNMRPDVAQFLYGNKGILCEFFPASMTNIGSTRVQVAGEKSGRSLTKLLDPVFLFKGKLQAAATRNKFSDAVDLLWLEGRFNAELRLRNNQFSRDLLGMAMKRYPHLEHAFTRLGVNINACKAKASDYVPGEASPNPPPMQVQNGLMFGLPAA